MILVSKFVKIVRKNLMKKKILIGHVVYINQNGAGKCGGVVESVVRINQVVNLECMRLKMIMSRMILKIQLR